MNNIEGTVALVTGAARGIGAATAQLCAQAGAQVVLTDVIDTAGADTASAIVAAGGEAVFVHQDVTSEADWQAVMAHTQDTFGKLDILVNNAGVLLSKPLEATTMDEYRSVTGPNLDGVFLGLKYGIPAMKDRAEGRASIINVSSVAGIIGAPGEAIYSMTKGGVRLLTKSAALECAALGYPIRVNSVHPGVIDTAMGDQLVADYVAMGFGENEAAVREDIVSRHALGRLGTPDDIARAILFLASEDAAFITGAELVVDGGFTAA